MRGRSAFGASAGFKLLAGGFWVVKAASLNRYSAMIFPYVCRIMTSSFEEGKGTFAMLIFPSSLKAIIYLTKDRIGVHNSAIHRRKIMAEYLFNEARFHDPEAAREHLESCAGPKGPICRIAALRTALASWRANLTVPAFTTAAIAATSSR